MYCSYGLRWMAFPWTRVGPPGASYTLKENWLMPTSLFYASILSRLSLHRSYNGYQTFVSLYVQLPCCIQISFLVVIHFLWFLQ